MNERIQSQFEGSNPFDFKYILPLKSIENFGDDGPSVVLASPGGLQSALSRQLFDIWCSDKKNACVVPGYLVERTLAKTIMNELKEVTLMNGLMAPLNMQVHCISFSAHADFSQTSAFLNELCPLNIILVHGEANEMSCFKQKLLTQFADQNMRVLTPKNCQTVEMHFNLEKTAKAIGTIAEKSPKEGNQVSGLLVRQGFIYQILATDDVHVFTQFSTGSITQRLTVPYKGAFSVLRHCLQQLYVSVESSNEATEVPCLKIHGKVRVKQEEADYVVIQWASDPITDMVSDSVIAMMMNFNPESPRTKLPESESMEGKVEKDSIRIVQSLHVSLFGDVKLEEDERKLIVSVDGIVASVDHASNSVDCENENLWEHVKVALHRLQLL